MTEQQSEEAAKKFAQAKIDASLHVALVMYMEGLSKADATVQAWSEGRRGLQSRVNIKG